MLRETINVMKNLRLINKSLGTEKIDFWVDEYLDEYRLFNKSITILTPWSISPRLIDRYKIQKNDFIPTRNEEKMFKKDIPNIFSTFKQNGFKINWWIYLSRSYLDSTMLDINIEKIYSKMLFELKKLHNTPIEIVNWEDDVICKRYYPNPLVESYFDRYVKESLYLDELERRAIKWFKDPTKVTLINKSGLLSEKTVSAIEKETKYKIACEAEEGRILIKENPFGPVGKFIFVPVGIPEKYNFFSVLVPEFKKRLVFILKPYPWRL